MSDFDSHSLDGLRGALLEQSLLRGGEMGDPLADFVPELRVVGRAAVVLLEELFLRLAEC